MTTPQSMATGVESARELRVRRAYSMPVDPLYVSTMPDYDISLLLFRTWCNYDEGRVALPALVQSWTFDSNSGTYTFEIDSDAKWSTGLPVTPKDLLANIQRAISNGTSYGHAFEALVDVKTFKTLTPRKFQLQTRDKQPSTALFQRLGSIFLAVASPADFPSGNVGRLRSNSVSGGPFLLKSSSKSELEFTPNGYFKKRDEHAAQRILIRPPEDSFDLDSFLDGKTWENLAQLTTIIPANSAKRIIKEKYPYWTRGHDRVSLLKPVGKGDDLIKRRKLLQIIAAEFSRHTYPVSELKVTKAQSLQPFGYPLWQTLTFPQPKDRNIAVDVIRILGVANYYGDFHRTALAPVFDKLGLKVNWVIVPPGEYFKALREGKNVDYVLRNFGVADPEPTTWMSLVIDQEMVDIDESDRIAFKKAAALGTKEVEVAQYKGILETIAKRGSYLPLFHLSTLAVGQKGISLKLMNELDETVDLSKVLFE